MFRTVFFIIYLLCSFLANYVFQFGFELKIFLIVVCLSTILNSQIISDAYAGVPETFNFLKIPYQNLYRLLQILMPN